MNIIDISCAEVETDLDIIKIRNFCEMVLQKRNIDNWELSILLCNDSFIQSLNHRYRDIDAPTDVLSFPQGDVSHDGKQITAGDIVISLEFIKKNCENYGETVENEMKRLIIHGILHLSGLHHEDLAPEQPMLKIQEDLVEQLTGAELF